MHAFRGVALFSFNTALNCRLQKLKKKKRKKPQLYKPADFL